MIESRQVKSPSSPVRSFQGETHTHIKTRTLRQVKSKRSIHLPSRQVKPHTTTFVAEPTRAARSARRATLRTSTEHRRALNAARRAIHNEMHPRSIHVIHARPQVVHLSRLRSAKMGLGHRRVKKSSKGDIMHFHYVFLHTDLRTLRRLAPQRPTCSRRATRRDGARLSAHRGAHITNQHLLCPHTRRRTREFVEQLERRSVVLSVVSRVAGEVS